MKVAQINVTCGSGSTGKICVAVSRLLTEKNIENKVFYSQGTTDHPSGVCFQKPYEIKLNAVSSRVLGNWGFEARAATKRLISSLRDFKPDIVQLHNLHGHNVHLGMLFDYLRESGAKVFWTFHDCWAFTGYCPHYYMAGCDRWQSGCSNCVQKKCYSLFFDRSAILYERKKNLYSQFDFTIITPSLWLKDEVKKSFLSEKEVKVINNGVDLSVFQPIKSDFKKRYGLEDRYVILGVAFKWGKRKGADVFAELSKRLDPKRFAIVLVGTDESVDKSLPDSIIKIRRTRDQHELAEIYSAADVFVNPTREDNFPTVNIESLACGTPVVTFDTGGSAECIDEASGSAVECDDIDSMQKEIERICLERPFSQSSCVKRAQRFDMNDRFKEYVALYTGTV